MQSTKLIWIFKNKTDNFLLVVLRIFISVLLVKYDPEKEVNFFKNYHLILEQQF